MANLVAVPEKSKAMMAQLEKLRPHLARVLPPDVRPDKAVMVAYTSIQRNPSLLECSVQSIMASVMSAGQLGLVVDPVLGQAYLVPFKGQCTLIVGYKGLAALAWRTKMVRDITRDIVREHDEFDAVRGDNPSITHKIVQPLSKRGALTHAYCIISTTTGGKVREVMDAEEIEAIHKRSPSFNARMSPWVTDYDQMALKTVMRRACKMMPMSGERESNMLARAIGYDEQADIGMDPPVDVEVQDAVDRAVSAEPLPESERKERVDKLCRLLASVKTPAEERAAFEAMVQEHDDVRYDGRVADAKQEATARVHGGGS